MAELSGRTDPARMNAIHRVPVECSETQYGRFRELRHIHTHKANALEVADSSDSTVVLLNRDFEQVPFGRIVSVVIFVIPIW